ncbi:DUF1835 domain-containing protein [Bauldia sp.]|uniref:DUF1835 domain-containing protein n=1 Tax=Bauldia sp. TaxID=2575872 RepID=UPI003BACBE08
MGTLIITNGDSAADLLAEAGRDGVILPWRDVLHEGPITAGPLAEQSRIRAAFLAERLNLNPDEVHSTFVERDTIIGDQRRYDTIELWFEHDLYDQLQVVQILSVLAGDNRTDRVTFVQADDFIATQRPDTVLRFAEKARPIDAADLQFGAALWADLAASTPRPTVSKLPEVPAGFPFLGPALRRFLEELPGKNGLSRTETTILTLIDQGIHEPIRVFPETLAAEEAAFMGDNTFFAIVDDLLGAPTPLITGVDRIVNVADQIDHLRSSRLSLTEAGRAVLGGTADHVALDGVNRWWAGTRLEGRDVWRYDRDAAALVPPRASAA